MVIECPACKTRFAIDAQQLVGVENPRFHCSRCNNVFELPKVNAEDAAPPEAAPQTPSAPAEQQPAPPPPPAPLPDAGSSFDLSDEDQAQPEQLNLLPADSASEKHRTIAGLRQGTGFNSLDEELPFTAEWPDTSADRPFEVDLSAARASLEQRESRGASAPVERPPHPASRPAPSRRPLAPADDQNLESGSEFFDARADWDTAPPPADDFSEAFVEHGLTENGMRNTIRTKISAFASPLGEEETAEEQYEEQEWQLAGGQEAEEADEPPPHDESMALRETTVTDIKALLLEGEHDERPGITAEEALLTEDAEQDAAAAPRLKGSLSDKLLDSASRLKAYQETLSQAVGEEPGTAEPEPALRERNRTLSGWMALGTALIFPALLIGVFWFWSRNIEASPAVVRSVLGLDPVNLPKLPPPGMVLIDAKSNVLSLDTGDTVLELRGFVLNTTSNAYKNLKLEARIYDEGNVSIHSKVVDLNNPMVSAHLNALGQDAIEKLQSSALPGDAPVRPGQKAPFRIVFTKLTGKERWFSARVFTVTPGAAVAATSSPQDDQNRKKP